MLFKYIIAVYAENLTKPVNTPCGQSAELSGCTYKLPLCFKYLSPKKKSKAVPLHAMEAHGG
jgi:hypothetical protein